jgi:hypothetical protein
MAALKSLSRVFPYTHHGGLRTALLNPTGYAQSLAFLPYGSDRHQFSLCLTRGRGFTARPSLTAHTQYESSKPILMSHHPRSRQPTLGPHLRLKEPTFEHPQRTEERRRHHRIERPQAVAQVSPLAHQRGDNSRSNRYLPKINCLGAGSAAVHGLRRLSNPGSLFRCSLDGSPLRPTNGDRRWPKT